MKNIEIKIDTTHQVDFSILQKLKQRETSTNNL